jgi:hypothetical protein
LFRLNIELRNESGLVPTLFVGRNRPVDFNYTIEGAISTETDQDKPSLRSKFDSVARYSTDKRSAAWSRPDRTGEPQDREAIEGLSVALLPDHIYAGDLRARRLKHQKERRMADSAPIVHRPSLVSVALVLLAAVACAPQALAQSRSPWRTPSRADDSTSKVTVESASRDAQKAIRACDDRDALFCVANELARYADALKEATREKAEAAPAHPAVAKCATSRKAASCRR